MAWGRRLKCLFLCRFLDAGDDEPLSPLMRPASENLHNYGLVHRRKITQ